MTPPANVAASVRQRLLNMARAREEDFNLVLTRYGIERLLYRLSQSEHSDEFVLKGATLFYLWVDVPHRPTRDLDLLGRGAPRLDRLETMFRDMCGLDVEDDGLDILAETVAAESIREDAAHDGIRVKLEARLDGACIRLQVDIGFGDATFPAPEICEFPVLLDQPAPRLRAYRRETVIAEKLQAIVDLGMATSRMKDFYDLRVLAARFDFAGAAVAGAIKATFDCRDTSIHADIPAALTASFASDDAKRIQWTAFVRRTRLEDSALTLGKVLDDIRRFVMPPLNAISRGEPFDKAWRAGGPWRGTSS